MNISTANISFCGIKKSIKKQFYSTNKFSEYVNKSNEEDYFVDSEPPCLNFAYDKGCFKERFEAFSKEFRPVIDTVGNIQYYKYGGRYNAYDDDSEDVSIEDVRYYTALSEGKVLAENIDKLFKKYGFIPQDSTINVTACEGNENCNYGAGYKIIIKNERNKTEDSLFLKVFFKDYKTHLYSGKIPEITRSIYLNHNMGKHKNFPMFYFGDITHDAPYLISEFIEPNMNNLHRQYPHELLGIKFNDHSLLDSSENKHNIIGDYFIDAGKILPINSLAFDSVARSISKKIFRTPEKFRYDLWQKFYEGTAGKIHPRDYMAGLVYSIKHLPKEVQKSCYEQILNSKYANLRSVQIAILCQPDLYNLISDNQEEKKEFFQEKYKKLQRETFLNAIEKEYIKRNLAKIL